MWLGTKNFNYLRLAVFHIAFIWLSSLALPWLSHWRRLPEHWRRRLRLLINYFQRNFYQQLLFFILPIYFLSASWGAGNMLFVGLLAVSALLRDRLVTALGGGEDLLMSPDVTPVSEGVRTPTEGMTAVEEARAALAEDLNLNVRLIVEHAFMQLAATADRA